MKKKIYGYVRVSTKEQNLDRQLIAMRKFGVPEEHTFVDRQSGKDFARPAYREMLNTLDEGATLVVKSIDRLGRNYDETIDEWRKITREKGAHIIVLDMPILCTLQQHDLLGRLIADLVLYLLSYFSQAERDMNRQRQREGIAAARLRGVRFGAEPKKRTAEFYSLKEKWKSQGISARKAAAQIGIDHKTFLRWAKDNKMIGE